MSEFQEEIVYTRYTSAKNGWCEQMVEKKKYTLGWHLLGRGTKTDEGKEMSSADATHKNNRSQLIIMDSWQQVHIYATNFHNPIIFQVCMYLDYLP